MNEILDHLERLWTLIESTPITIELSGSASRCHELVTRYTEGRDAMQRALSSFRRVNALLNAVHREHLVNVEA